MSTFRFKHFSVTNERSAMRVNTDGVLLGAAMGVRSEDRRLLDIGTGTGTIALMAAQRLSAANAADFLVEAIDIDVPSAEEAAANFAASPWAACLEAHLCPLGEWSPKAPYDLIFSNPPYFDNSLTNPDERDCAARHTESLSYREILVFAAENLSEKGRLALVLPAEEQARLLREARSRGLHPFRLLKVRTTPSKQPRRLIAEFSRERCAAPLEEELVIQNKGGYTSEYLALTSDFYLFA